MAMEYYDSQSDAQANAEMEAAFDREEVRVHTLQNAVLFLREF